MGKQGVDRSQSFRALGPLHAQERPRSIRIASMQVVAAQAGGESGYDEWSALPVRCVSAHGEVRPEVLTGRGSGRGEGMPALGEDGQGSSTSGGEGHAAGRDQCAK